VNKKPRLGQSGGDQADSEEEEEDFSQRNTFVAGETDTVEFFSSSETKYAGAGCRSVPAFDLVYSLSGVAPTRYFVAVHNRRTQTTIFRPAPLHILCRQVKALKSIGAAPVTTQERVAARAALGESFGTKKAQAAIRAAERNKVDVVVMENVLGHLVDRIGKNTAALPTRGTCSGR
jgi:DNA-directed RNA polymerase I subunit RPA49